MLSRYTRDLAALGLLLILGGCGVTPDEGVADASASDERREQPPVPVQREYVICPELVPPGECVGWVPVARPLDMLHCQADALDGADIHQACRQWLRQILNAYRLCQWRIDQQNLLEMTGK